MFQPESFRTWPVFIHPSALASRWTPLLASTVLDAHSDLTISGGDRQGLHENDNHQGCEPLIDPSITDLVSVKVCVDPLLRPRSMGPRAWLKQRHTLVRLQSVQLSRIRASETARLVGRAAHWQGEEFSLPRPWVKLATSFAPQNPAQPSLRQIFAPASQPGETPPLSATLPRLPPDHPLCSCLVRNTNPSKCRTNVPPASQLTP